MSDRTPEDDPGGPEYQDPNLIDGSNDMVKSNVVELNSHNQRELLFDPEDMLVEDLRKECKERKIPSSGPKAEVVKRLKQAIATNPTLPLQRLTSDAKRKKKPTNKREPAREDYLTDQEYNRAWQTWREQRDHNNESVKKSRQAAKVRKSEHERLCQAREKENQELAKEVKDLKDEVMFLTNALKSPSEVTETDKQRLSSLIETIGQGANLSNADWSELPPPKQAKREKV